MDKEFDRAWKLIAAPERHCKGTNAKDKNDRPCFMDEPEAVKWCMYGAIYTVRGPELANAVQTVYGLTNLNDSVLSHTQVVEWLKERDL